MLRVLDFLIAVVALIFSMPLLILVWFAGLWDTGAPLFFQRRVGRHQKPFTLVKFRTMRRDTPDMASHLASAGMVTRWGAFLRRTKLDELPQLFNVVVGDMSLVGPRPCLFSQTELVCERERRGVFKVRPGITGLAQIQGVDMSDPVRLAKIDAEMTQHFSLKMYFKLLFWTALGKGRGDRVKSS
ncbi:sugar transferase [Permianibacter aggregans]|uniref:Lipopolysaccharide/colanic/teichoic acid biosynthesis glycosyltransferase n=1 Tax=Permianibacter aggregans TaxID=1510150 RepID=A0A4R6UUT2_9GAMM|nr:sugar transferase [Permianibacter aggregans]QGX41341.1 sugar transferase [Permianibacter aggregans]TDQ51128.1 lipopolysaccharide/colanic/teichoic acid biosynthesis glycosyltransferase [Permianibacter aggregans]